MTAPIIDADALHAWGTALGQRARAAERLLRTATGESKNAWLLASAKALERRADDVLSANKRDMEAAREQGIGAALLDRLELTPTRLQSAAEGLRAVAALPEPVGRVLESRVRPNGLKIEKVSVPLGVILFIYESRPNVTLDAAALCVKSGNALILRGGKEARHSNALLHAILQEELPRAGLPRDAAQLVDDPRREAVAHLLTRNDCIDLVIPRGGEGLIRAVEAEARMHVMKHYKGNCHVYVESSADLAMAERIVVNAKCQRPGVCNAAESLLVDAMVAEWFLPTVGHALREQGVELRGCAETCRILSAAGIQASLATEEDYAAEYLDLILSVKIVKNLPEALEHVARYGSGHTEAIVTRDPEAARQFVSQADASAVMVNASTRFNDGFELGLGAEIGISTDKFHARGPCGLQELTCYKYVVRGEGQVRG